MIYPITIYGHPVLRKETVEIDKDYPNLSTLIDDMFKTMHNADGVGLAAPQIGLNIRLFVVDLELLAEDDDKYKGFRKAFMNLVILGILWLCQFVAACQNMQKISCTYTITVHSHT